MQQELSEWPLIQCVTIARFCFIMGLSGALHSQRHASRAGGCVQTTLSMLCIHLNRPGVVQSTEEKGLEGSWKCYKIPVSRVPATIASTRSHQGTGASSVTGPRRVHSQAPFGNSATLASRRRSNKSGCAVSLFCSAAS
uniref:Uncharacterized protein n=1 Tax=Sphaerodactylus townsendi TaxID=933632 RepID=A0ACB8ECV6_9SAUR